MSKESNKRAVTVGIFIFLGLAIFIAAVLTLGGQQKTFEKKITIKAIFDDVGGLQAGNNVWFSGVKIGTIRRMNFYGTSQVEVEMNIEEKVQQYIRKNAKAKISSEGFIGSKIVEIYGGSMNAQAVEAGDVLGVEKSASTDEIMTTFQENNRNLLEITNNFKVISQRLAAGEGTVGKLLTDEALVNSLQVAVTGMRQAAANAERLTSDLSAYTAKLQRKGTLASDLVSDTVVFNRLRSTMVQLQQASRTANEVTNNLHQVSTKLNSTDGPVGVLLNDPQAAENLKGTLENLQGGTKKLDENMEALQHNFLFRGFFRKKAKREAAAKEND